MSQEKNKNQPQTDSNKPQKKFCPLWLWGGRIGFMVAILIVIIRPANPHIREVFLFVCRPALYLISLISKSDATFHLSGLALFLSYFLAGALIGMFIQVGRNFINKK